MPEPSDAALLRPYLPRLVLQWFVDEPERLSRELGGSAVLVDISGFTRISERLARKGKVGAEEITEVLGAVFDRLLSLAYAEGGDLLKFGGDALFLFFSGDEHPRGAVGAAARMRRGLHQIDAIQTSAGRVRLKVSVGVHSGLFQFFLVGDSHREFVISGPGASETVLMEETATASQILMSPATARSVPRSWVGPWKDAGFLLRTDSSGDASHPKERRLDLSEVDVSRAVPFAIRSYLQTGLVDAEHRKVAIGFVHYDDMDLLVTEEGVRSAALALHELVCDVQDAADRHGVTFLGSDVDRDGGKIILTAGAPAAVGDDEERMLLTLRAIVERRRRLAVRLGVSFGPVFAGSIGPEYRRTYTIMGDAVNLSARLTSKAGAGEVIATKNVLEASAARFRVESLPPFLVRGKTTPIVAFSVGPRERSRQRWDRMELPLVGRERELGELDDSLVSLREGRGRLLEIVGPPGIGKSRLLNELRERSAGLKRLEAACELYRASVPYAVFRNVLRDAMGLPDDADAPTLERLQHEIRSRMPHLDPWIPLIAVAMGLDVPSTDEVRQLDESFRKDQLERVVAAFLAEVVDDPTIILVEDVHWIDELSRDLLARLVSEQLTDAPWLICVTRRDVATGFVAPSNDLVHTIVPPPLAPDDARVLVESATEDAPLLPRETAILAERSGGNPLFLQELARVSREGGVEALPDSVEGVITAQIDKLALADRGLLRTASVLGAVFGEALLARLLDVGTRSVNPAVWERLDAFVVPDDRGTWRFRHTLMRDAAYEGLPYRRRRDLHARAGELIEEAAGDVADVAELLSLHYFNARRYPEAWRHSVIAGHRARDQFSNGQAVEFYDRALDAAPRLADVEPRDVAEVREALADVLVRMGDFRRARTVYRDARRSLGDDALATARILLKEARIPERLGRYSDSLRWLRRAGKVLDGLDGVDVLRQRAQLSVFHASIRVAQGRARDARTWCVRAIEEADASGDREALAHAYYILDWALMLEGRGAGYENSSKALEIYRALRDPAGQAVVLNNLGAFKYFDGDWDEAVVLYKQGRDARERTGDPVNAAYGTCNIGEILLDQGRLDEAEPLLRDARRVWRAAGDAAGVAFAESLLGRLASRAGRPDEAIELLDRARATFVRVGSQADTLEVDARVAECVVLQGLADEALKRVSTALVQAEALVGVSIQTALLQRIHGFALMQLGRLDDAAAAFDSSLLVAQSRNAPYDAALTMRAIAQLARLRGSESSASGRESDRILSELGVVAVPHVPDNSALADPESPSLTVVSEGRRGAPHQPEVPTGHDHDLSRRARP